MVDETSRFFIDDAVFDDATIVRLIGPNPASGKVSRILSLTFGDRLRRRISDEFGSNIELAISIMLTLAAMEFEKRPVDQPLLDWLLEFADSAKIGIESSM